MIFVLGIVAEPWERAYAWATVDACLGLIPSCDRLLVPDFLAPLPDTIRTGVEVVPVACGHGFASADSVTDAIAAAAGVSPLLLLSAGALPTEPGSVPDVIAGVRPAFRWTGPPSQLPALVQEWSTPVHRPPAVPRHMHRRFGTLDVWRVDTGEHYFQAIDSLSGLPPVFSQYGRAAPLFIYNTSDFSEPPPPPCDDYVILGSGLLGLRLVSESNPPPGARLLVYDINPGALIWTDFVLSNAHRLQTFPDLVDAFRVEHPDIAIREIAMHEHENAGEQECWYRDRRAAVAALSHLERVMVQVDVLTAPSALFRLLRSDCRTMVMYLDLFVPWNITGTSPWVCDAPDIARSFETAVRDIVRSPVHFVPSDRTQGFQISPQSPFLG
jgi:hypothetical protein